jgi:glycosyltransferase involved in cell wall biosynthesis
MKKIWIVLPFFYVGGVEKWALALAAELRESFDVRLICIGVVDEEATQVFSEFPIERIAPLKLIWDVITGRAPDICFAALTPANLFVCALFFFSKTKVVTSTHLTLAFESAKNKSHFFRRRLLYFIIGGLSDAVVAVSRGVSTDLRVLAGVRDAKIFTIYNPCFDRIPSSRRSVRTITQVKFVSAGRLHDQKGFDLLLVAWADAVKDVGQEACSLEIFGDGDLRADLENQAASLGLTNVHFRGNVSGLVSRLSDFDAFLLSSRYEGFGNVLAEALAAGNYCISFDCPHGPSEILDKGSFGSILPPLSIQSMSDEIKRCVHFVSREQTLPAVDELAVNAHLTQFTRPYFGDRIREFVSAL